MFKGIINAFDRMQFCLAINLTATGLSGKRTVFFFFFWPPALATQYASFTSFYFKAAEKVNF